MKKLISMREALSDPELLGGELRGASWAAWRVLLIAAVGEALTDEERVIFAKLTGGREREPLELVEVLLIVAGRRSGKTKAMSVLSIYLSCFCDWSDDLSLGERGVCLFMAPTERMAMEAHRYSTALVDKIGGLRDLVDNRTQDTLTLKTGITIETRPANWRSARGFTSVAIVLDESAYLYSAEDSANPDIEILRAVKPTLATTGGPMLLTSSPASMQGIVFRLHKQHFGKDGDPKCLIVQSESLELNPTLKRSVIDRAYDLDAEGAADAYSGEFREPLSAYLVRSIVEAAVEKGVEARPVLPGIQYFAFVDVAGGTGKDAYALAIGHRQGRDKIVIDQVVQTPPPFNPDAVTEICARWLKQYRCWDVVGDNYGGGWPVSCFARHGIRYQLSPLSASDLYFFSLPAWTSGRVVMLDCPAVIDQLCNLRRKIGSGGAEKIIHFSQSHDDAANVVAGLIWRLSPTETAAGFSSWGGFGVVTGPRPAYGSAAEDTTASYLRSLGRRESPRMWPIGS